MKTKGCRILSVVPYRFLPVTNGGHAAIAGLHHHLAKICPDHIAGTRNNDDNTAFAFRLHKILGTGAKRYLPLKGLQQLRGLVKAYDINNVICEHPYMAVTVITLSRLMRIPWYLRSHNIESERFRMLEKKWWPALRQYERFAMRQASGVFFITPEDADWAMTNYGLPASKCHIIPYGTALETPPAKDEAIKRKLAGDIGISPDKPWLYFLGALDYYPNAHAVEYILHKLMPALNATEAPYHILIAGKGLPDDLKHEIVQTPGISYLGFVPDLSDMIRSCDVMLNPVNLGGGIKTKAVEALAYGKMVVSTQSGAAGLISSACGANLAVVPDDDVNTFCEETIKAIRHPQIITDEFYKVYNNDNIALKVIGIMQGNVTGSLR